LKKILWLLLTFLLLLSTACQGKPEPVVEESGTEGAVAEPAKPEAPQELSVMAVGDIMFHLPQIKEGRTETGYDFSLPFEKVKNLIAQADVAIGNFETTVNEKKKVSGFPRFNSPPEVVEGIGKAGFDVMVTANNHCMDTGVEGAENTAALIKESGMLPVGTGESKSAIVDKNGIRLGILAYTVTLNGLKAPAGYVSMADEKQIQKDIEAIRAKCDFLMVYMHAGMEYYRGVEPETERLFKSVADMGADCVLGSHPHVARKSELYQSGDRQVLINYSMGNFLSNQNDKYTDIGTITKLQLLKQEDKVVLKSFDILPTYRLRFADTDGKVKRRIVLVSEIENYSHISEAQSRYIKAVSDEVTSLLNQDTGHGLKIAE
jgi:poly-gamma-glutamate capsule biosynthesis protein CapA/YwtB (metallophosphatase superfamily)